ncbi:propanol-preferring alcohol dehydrogenase [Thermosporothrix hazakensis]|jgi:propanol-preferring alcohol dehydrogenase|uniref:alcohol dehydrogenase n=2 Tax=Thermosporothrix TaxID=768650 RepID=A0A326USS5_THEHA|nr:NAD(P)-dependent alcohol dehydrogenase [Thermosporothrix hazakensis]PZW34457.1 propanol-preferring alcohol dehydrogenase [Thermosporothrix hazakensis]
MDGKMLAYRMLDWQQPPQVVEIDVPRPGPGEVLVKVAGNGLCHSDIGMMQIPQVYGEMIGWRVPFTLGHEVGGWIEEIGEGVEGFFIGDPVALISPHSCGTCEYCLRGQDEACVQSAYGRGYGRDGGLAQYVIARAPRDLIKLKTLDPKVAAPLTDAGATSYHAVKRVLPKLIPGSTAVVIGAGGLGSFAIQLLRVLSPARVIAIDTNQGRLDFARELGAHDVLTGVTETTVKELQELTNGRGVDVVLDFVGIDATIAAGIAIVRKLGAFALVGAGGGTLQQPWFNALPKGAEIFCFQGSSIADAHEVIALAEAGLIRSEIDIYPFSRIEEAYKALDQGMLRGRAVVTPNE